MEQLSDDMLVEILRRVSLDSGSCQHALVCRRWLRLNAQGQVSLSIGGPGPARGSKSGILSLVCPWSAVASLKLSPAAVEGGVDDYFLGELSWSLPNLERFELLKGGRGDCQFTSSGLASLFSNCPRLKELILRDGSRSQPYAVSHHIGLLADLERLELFASHKHTHGTPQPAICGAAALTSRIASLSSLRVLSIGGLYMRTIPESIGALKSLEKLTLSCPSLESLPLSIGGLISLRELKVHSRELSSLPGSFWELRGLSTLELKCPMLHLSPTDSQRIAAVCASVVLVHHLMWWGYMSYRVGT